MTTGMNTGSGLRCPRCSHQAGPGHRFCEECGSALGAGPASAPWPPPDPGRVQGQVGHGPAGAVPADPSSDETTRYLCAAAHLDEEFCNKAIAEFLVEPVRAIPPSPGVNSAVVLREAIAARSRRRIRDSVLLVLLLALALVNVVTVLVWAAWVGLAVALQAFGRRRRKVEKTLLAFLGRGDRGTTRDAQGRLVSDADRSRRRLGLILVVLNLIFIPLPYIIYLAIPTPPADQRLEISPVPVSSPAGILLTLIFGILMLGVFVVDGATVAKLKHGSFRRDLFGPDARNSPSNWERMVRSLGRNAFRPLLHRIARTEESSRVTDQADVIVYRGYKPFVGAGAPVHHQFIALPLESSGDEEGAVPEPVNVNELHRHVAEAAAALRSPSSLGPGRRLEQLQHREQMIMPADRLLFHRFEQMQPPVLPRLDAPPLAQVPLGAARRLAENPLEWARYYGCFRVESWNRDLTTSCYLQIGTDQRMLYLEWTYCTLFPVDKRYRTVDDAPDSAWTIFVHCLLDLVLLPESFFRRLRSVFRRNTPLVQRPGEVLPARYGAEQSLRELAADTNAQNYFQDTDTERYINVMDGALFRAVGRYLEKHGYSVVEFMRQAKAVSNTFNINAPVTGSAIAVNSTMNNVQTKV